MAFRLVNSQEPIPQLSQQPTAEEVRNYTIDTNRVLREWYRTYQEATNRALNLPSFRVHRNGSDLGAVADTTHTLIAFTSTAGEGWDSHTFFDMATYRFTPKIAGVYHIGLSTKWKLTSGTAVELISSVYLNGVSIAETRAVSAAATTSPSVLVNTNVRMNGVTDFIDFYAYQSSGGVQDLNGLAINTFAYGYKVSDLPT